MRFLWENDLDSGTLTASTEDPNFVASSLVDTRLTTIWKSMTVGSQTIVVDLTNAASVSAIAIANHNFTASVTALIEGNSSDSWGAAPVSETITYRSTIMMLFFTAASYRYWRFSFDDPTNTDGFISVGRLFLGEYLQADPSSLIEFPEEHIRTDSFQTSEGNQLYADEGIGYNIYRYSYRRVEDTQKGNIESMHDTVGKHKPIFFTNFDTAYTVIEPIYCQIQNDITFRYFGGSKWDYDLTLREVN